MTRSRWFRAVQLIVGIDVLIFFLDQVAGPVLRSRVFGLYALSEAGLAEGRWWQFVTYAFLHGGTPSVGMNVLHLLLNMVSLWFAGRVVERVMGSGRFVALYLASAVAGGLLQVLLTGGKVPLVGASGAVCGVLLAFTTMFPEAQRVALLFFVVPVNLKAKYLGWLLTGSSLFFVVTGFFPFVGHAAHLGGCIAGYVFTRLAGYGVPTPIERWIFRTDGAAPPVG